MAKLPTQTYDEKRQIKPLGLEDIDRAFLNWWTDVLDLRLTNKDGEIQKVPAAFVTAERWHKARQDGLRDDKGTLILPIIVLARTATDDDNDGPTGRHFADTQQFHTYYKKIDPKSSKVKNLIEDVDNGRVSNINPSAPIYEVYHVPTPDHYSLTYSVSIWVAYVEDLNKIQEKIGNAFNYKSMKSFAFDSEDGFRFYAFKEEDLDEESNLDDYTDDERIIRVEYTFKVPGYIIPEDHARKSNFRRTWTQSTVSFKQETALTDEELQELLEGINE